MYLRISQHPNKTGGPSYQLHVGQEPDQGSLDDKRWENTPSSWLNNGAFTVEDLENAYFGYWV